jgi:crossover junction endodeoxyribonuclease RuvC
MLVIGIDPGTAKLGYGLVREHADGSLSAVTFGVIETPAELPMNNRLMKLYTGLSKVIALHRPDCSAVEELFFARNSRTAITVGEARGVVLLLLSDMAMDVHEYTPMEVKQAVTGYGGADKNQVQEMVRALLQLDSIPKPDDAADALAVAICHIHSYRLQSLVDDQTGE